MAMRPQEDAPRPWAGIAHQDLHLLGSGSAEDKLHATRTNTGSGAPASASFAGGVYYDTAGNALHLHDGSSWAAAKPAAEHARLLYSHPSGSLPTFSNGTDTDQTSWIYPGLGSFSIGGALRSPAGTGGTLEAASEANAGRFTSYINVPTDDSACVFGAGGQLVVDVSAIMPAGFGSWRAAGVELLTKVAHWDASATGGPFKIQLSAAGITSSRTVAATAGEGSYTTLSVTGAALAAADLGPWDELRLIVTAGNTSAGGGAALDLRLGRIAVHWGA